ncbi:MAG: hypothetical protein VX730_08375 [Pseudomonadota bacterium]|nr:hypothetical protein [Pseudomonadota bacterium]
MSQRNGVNIKLSKETGGITLAELFAGRSGTMNIGGDIHLWEAGEAPEGVDMICKVNASDDMAAKADSFKLAAKGHFSPAFVALLDCDEDELVESAKAHFHTVLVPCTKRENIPADFRARVLGYTS